MSVERLLRQQARLRSKVAELDPTSTFGRLDEYERGGLPSASFRDGSPSSELPLPGLDGLDRVLVVQRREYVNGFDQLEQLLDRLLKIQWAVTTVYEPKPSDFAVPCQNTACTSTPENPDRGFLTERDIDGGFLECERCRKHRSRYGSAWPNKTIPGLQTA